MAIVKKGQQLAGHLPDAEVLGRARQILEGEITTDQGYAEIDAKFSQGLPDPTPVGVQIHRIPQIHGVTAHARLTGRHNVTQIDTHHLVDTNTEPVQSDAEVQQLADALFNEFKARLDCGDPIYRGDFRTLARAAADVGARKRPEAAAVWSPGNPNDGTYEYVAVAGCYGTSLGFRKRRPALRTEAGRWESATDEEYAAAMHKADEVKGASE